MADKKKKSSKKSSKKGTKKAKKESKASKVEEEQEVTLDSFIEEKPTHKNGQIYLIVSEARALAKKNLFSKNNKSDPYTVITFEEEGEEKKKKKEDDPRVYKSKVLKKNLDPQWNEGSKIFPITKKDRKIVISLWNANKLRSDDFMGQITFDIIKINDGLPYQDWYQLQSREGKKDKIKGEIHLQLMYIGEDDKVTGDEFKWPLHSFLAKRRLDIVAKLIKRKEAIDKKDANQLTPLHIAAKANLFDGVRLLLSAGADHSITGGEDALLPIHSACTASPESVKYLLEADTTTVAAKDANENTPLHTAASNDQPTTVLLLLSKKAKINEQNKAGDTPLHCAIKARAFQAMKALVDSKADIYVRNNDKLTCGELAASIDEETKELFMAAVDVEDYAEIGYLETWKQKTKIESKGMSHNWAKSPQFIITAKTSKKKKKKKDDAPKQIKCKILVHHKGQPDNTQLGFFVLRAENTVYNQPCYTELCAYDDGKVETIIGEDEKLPHLVVVPYAKLKETAGEISVMVFTMEGQEVEIKQLKKWPHSTKISGAWKGSQAGGCQNEKTWHKNPFFSLKTPAEEVDVAIVLAQKQTAMDAASMAQYQILPYEYYIGFYLYDGEVKTMAGQCRKWKNTKEIFANFTLNGEERRLHTIIPTTFKAKEETSFTIYAYSNKPVKLSKFEC